MASLIGTDAPSFSLYATDRKKVNLSDFSGKNVLLLFYPMAFSSTCTGELCTIRDDISRYNNANAQVLGISVDSVFTLKKYKEDHQYNFPLLSDFNREASSRYGCLYDEWIMEMKGVSKRAAFIIDRHGKIQYAEVLENADDELNFNAIHVKLASLDRI